MTIKLKPMSAAVDYRDGPIMVWLPDAGRWAIYYWVKGLHRWMEIMGDPEEPQGFVVMPEPPPPQSPNA